MNKKNFLVIAVILIVLVSVITSYITISAMKKKLLPAPFGTGGEGKIEVTGTGITTPVVNVIIIDDTIIATVDDVVNFTDVTKGIEYSTSSSDIQGATTIRPFVIRNEGNVISNVEVYSTQQQLFGSASSYVKFFVEPAKNTMQGFGFGQLDDCAINGPCYASTSCTSAAPCNLPYSTDGSVRQLAVSSLQYLDSKDEALIGIKIYVANDEGAGTKWTKFVVFGSQA